MFDKIPATFDSLRRIVSEGQAYRLKWEGTRSTPLCDTFTASAILKVLDSVNEDLKEKMRHTLNLGPGGLLKLQTFALRVLGR